MRDQTHAKRPTDIMIVDDAPENLDMLVEIFKRSSFHIRPVTSARVALQAAQSQPPDMILLDIDMPDMDGLSLCGYFKGNEKLKDIPVIIISGVAGPDEIRKVFAAGGDDYIVKPFQSVEVLARVETHLALRFLRSELELYKKKYGAMGK